MITPQMTRIRDGGWHIAQTTHWAKRNDRKYEIVATLTPEALDELQVNIGGAVCLHVADNRVDALEAVRFFRHQTTAKES